MEKRFLFFVIIAVIVTFVFGNTFFVFASPRFSPGQTLNPNCAPTDPDCTVTTSTGALGAISSLTQLNQQDAIQLNPYGVGAGNTAEIRFLGLTANGTQYVGLKAPDSISANKIWVLPSADGTSGQVLVTNGSGVLSWTSVGGGGTSSTYFAGTGLLLATSTFSLSTPVSLANGGTGANLSGAQDGSLKKLGTLLVVSQISNNDIANNAAIDPSKFGQGGATNGQVLQWNGTQWSPATVSSTNSTGTIYSAGTGLSLVGTTFNLANTSVSAGTYGSSTQVPQFVVDAQGRITSVTNVSLPSGTSYTAGNGLTLLGTTFSLSTPISVANGGTGSNTTSSALLGLVPSVTGNGGEFLSTNGLGIMWVTGTMYSAGTGLVLNGSLFSLSSPVSVANGGTALTALGSGNQLLGVNAGGAGLEYKTSIAGSDIVITNGTGSLTVAVTSTPTFNQVNTSNLAIDVRGGTVITGHYSILQKNVTTSNIPQFSCATYATIAVSGVTVTSTIIAEPVAQSGGIETKNLAWNWYVPSAGNVRIRACNDDQSGDIKIPNTQTWRVDVWNH